MLDVAQMRDVLMFCANDLISRENELCQLDSYVGDGDHGVTVKRGFTAIKQILEQQDFSDYQSLFSSCAMELMNQLGGAIGPIFASIFMGMAQASTGKETLGVHELRECFRAALESVKQIGGAKEGDRTLVDTLSPAVAALENCSTDDIHSALTEAAEAGYNGAQSTKDMVAKMGRAHFLGEKSKGYVDAGAMTMYYFIKSMADAVK